MSGRTVHWVNPTVYEDGSPLNGQQEIAGYGVSIDGQVVVSVPSGYATSIDLSVLAVWATLKRGSHTVAISVVAKDGGESVYSGTSTFPVVVRPSPVTSVTVV